MQASQLVGTHLLITAAAVQGRSCPTGCQPACLRRRPRSSWVRACQGTRRCSRSPAVRPGWGVGLGVRQLLAGPRLRAPLAGSPAGRQPPQSCSHWPGLGVSIPSVCLAPSRPAPRSGAWGSAVHVWGMQQACLPHQTLYLEGPTLQKGAAEVCTPLQAWRRQTGQGPRPRLPGLRRCATTWTASGCWRPSRGPSTCPAEWGGVRTSTQRGRRLFGQVLCCKPPAGLHARLWMPRGRDWALWYGRPPATGAAPAAPVAHMCALVYTLSRETAAARDPLQQYDCTQTVT